MCEKRKTNRIDKCLIRLIEALKSSDHKPLASCCGHGKYPTTIVVRSYGNVFELMSGKPIFRKKKFYKKDKQGHYYIPEVI